MLVMYGMKAMYMYNDDGYCTLMTQSPLGHPEWLGL